MDTVRKASEILEKSREEAKGQASLARESLLNQQRELERIESLPSWIILPQVKKFFLQRKIQQTKRVRKKAVRRVGAHIGAQAKLQKGDFRPAIKLLRQIAKGLRSRNPKAHLQEDEALLSDAAEYVHRIADELEALKKAQ